MQTATIEERLLQFIKDCWENQYSLEILLFLGKHPCAQFNQMVFVRGSTGQRLDMERAMKTLVTRGLVKVFTNTYVPLFSLTTEEPVRSLVLELVSLTRQQLQVALKQVHQPCEPPEMLPAVA